MSMCSSAVQRWIPLLDPEMQDTFLDASERMILFTSTVTICCVVAGILSPTVATIAAIISPLAVGIFISLIAQIYRNTVIRVLQPTITNVTEAALAIVVGLIVWRGLEDCLLYKMAYR